MSSGQPQLTLKERIAALQQAKDAPQPKTARSTSSSTTPGSVNTSGVMGRIATFEEKGGSSISPPAVSRSPSANSQGRRMSMHGPIPDEGSPSPGMRPLSPALTGGSFISPSHTGGSFKEPITRSTDFHSALNRARRAERRSSMAKGAPSESKETASRASSPPSAFLLGEPIALVGSEPEPIVAGDLSSPPPVSQPSSRRSSIQVSRVASTDATPKQDPPASNAKASIDTNGLSSKSDVTGSRQPSRASSISRNSRASVQINNPTSEPVTSPPRKAASIKLPKSRPSISVNDQPVRDSSDAPPVPALPSQIARVSGLPAQNGGVQDTHADGLPSPGFDLVDLLQNAAVLESHLVDGKAPADLPPPTQAPEKPSAVQTPAELTPQPPQTKPTSREPSKERVERPRSGLMSAFSRGSNRKSAVIESKEQADTDSKGLESQSKRADLASPPRKTSTAPSNSTSPSKSSGGVFSSFRRLASGSRSTTTPNSSRHSLSAGSELSLSDESYVYPTGTSDTSEFGTRQGLEKPSPAFLSPKKSQGSLGRASTFAGKMFGRSRTKSNNSTTAPSELQERASTSSALSPLPQIPQEAFDYRLDVPGLPASASPVTTRPPPISVPPSSIGKYSGAPKLGPIGVLSSESVGTSSPTSSLATGSPLFDFDAFPAPPTPSTIRQSTAKPADK